MPEQLGIEVRDLRADEYHIAYDFAAQNGEKIPDTYTMRTIAITEDAGEPRGVQVFDWTRPGVEAVRHVIAVESPEQREKVVKLLTDRIAVVREYCGFDNI